MLHWLFGRHPRGLPMLFFSEMWERFSFYGMKALLFLYITKYHLFGDEAGYDLLGAYGGLVYAMPMVGGLLADRYLGMRKAVVFGGLMIWVAFALDIGADTGWFSYVPLSGPEYSPGKRVDFWAQMITFTEVAALAVSVEIVVTVLKQRAPGMTPARVPEWRPAARPRAALPFAPKSTRACMTRSPA